MYLVDVDGREIVNNDDMMMIITKTLKIIIILLLKLINIMFAVEVITI